MRGRLAVEVKLAGEQRERKRKDPLTGRQKRNEGRMGDKRENGNNGCRIKKRGGKCQEKNGTALIFVLNELKAV